MVHAHLGSAAAWTTWGIVSGGSVAGPGAVAAVDAVPGHEHLRERGLGQVLRGMPVTAEQIGGPPEPRAHRGGELNELLGRIQ